MVHLIRRQTVWYLLRNDGDVYLDDDVYNVPCPGIGQKDIHYDKYNDRFQSAEFIITGFRCGLCNGYTKHFGLLNSKGDAFLCDPNNIWEEIENTCVILCQVCCDYAGIDSTGFRSCTHVAKQRDDNASRPPESTYSHTQLWQAQFMFRFCVRGNEHTKVQWINQNLEPMQQLF